VEQNHKTAQLQSKFNTDGTLESKCQNPRTTFNPMNGGQKDVGNGVMTSITQNKTIATI